ncbi:D-alanine--D-alanine ligase family protein [Microlunatus capsulatus]|uniref:D-alanine--D-alanine ligase n=1 Tax=Microlunatus capsulatus TaxID=99117 RepID=A0ABS4ZCM9_9ACTN|nr:D-alanine--D-alanine ligase family protein [Microlunatus capsulatus]MBP2418823.1 D-alanine-D-alanine ligase [Microlunatus capsulatus]
MSDSLSRQDHAEDGRTRVAVVFGGTSSEHGVSCLTAAGVSAALDPERYEVLGIGITRSGRWVLVDDATLAGLQVADGRLPELGEDAADAVLLREGAGTELARRAQDGPERSALAEMGRIDVAFALLHGPFGEDGTIQGLFEMMGTRYVGAGVLASAVGMDKQVMKLVLAASGLPVGPFVSIPPARWAADRTACLEAVAALGMPVFVKPARGGSSLGISRVDRPEDLVAAVEEAQRFDPKVIVEEGFVGARELECGVLADLDGGPPAASQVAEIRVQSASGFYDFEAKYLPEEQVALDVPADIPAELADRVRAVALATFDAIGCEGLARVDVFVTREGQVVVNEINTMPGFTPHSMFPRMWAASGVPYPELVDRLVQLALRRPLGLR